MCEFCSLAVDPGRGKRGSSIVLGLFKHAFAYVHHLVNVTDLCVTLKPSHELFYRRLRFAELGGLRRDARFGRAETIALRLTTETARRFWESGEALVPRNYLAAFLSETPSMAEQDKLLGETTLGLRSPEEILEWIQLLPEALIEANAAQREHLKKTFERKLAERPDCLERDISFASWCRGAGPAGCPDSARQPNAEEVRE
jgi:hypothetical protein